MSLNEMPTRNREFDHLKVGDNVMFDEHLRAKKVTVIELSATVVMIEGGRCFKRSTGFACDGSMDLIAKL